MSDEKFVIDAEYIAFARKVCAAVKDDGKRSLPIAVNEIEALLDAAEKSLPVK